MLLQFLLVLCLGSLEIYLVCVIDGSRVTGAFMQTSEDLTHYLLDDKHHCYKLWLRSIACLNRPDTYFWCNFYGIFHDFSLKN